MHDDGTETNFEVGNQSLAIFIQMQTTQYILKGYLSTGGRLLGPAWDIIESQHI